MAIQCSGSRTSAEVLSESRGTTSNVSRSMSGWYSLLNSTSPSAPAVCNRSAKLPMAVNHGLSFTARGIEISAFTSSTSSA